MKYVKMLGLAAAAAMALMAFLGASSASAASVFCKNPGETGSCGSPFPNETPFDASLEPLAAGEATTAILEVGTTVLDTCSGSTVQGKTVIGSGPGATVQIKEGATGLSWEGCTRTTTTLETGQLEVEHITGEAGTRDGTVRAKNFQVTVNTIFGSCVYGFGSTFQDLGKLLQSTSATTPATFRVTAAVPKISGPCPGTSATWTAAYLITEPKPLYISES